MINYVAVKETTKDSKYMCLSFVDDLHTNSTTDTPVFVREVSQDKRTLLREVWKNKKGFVNHFPKFFTVLRFEKLLY